MSTSSTHTPVIDIRDPDGKVLLAADDQVSYDWATHTMTLKDQAKVGVSSLRG